MKKVIAFSILVLLLGVGISYADIVPGMQEEGAAEKPMVTEEPAMEEPMTPEEKSIEEDVSRSERAFGPGVENQQRRLLDEQLSRGQQQQQ